jgi:hypothetical protein
LRAFQRVVAFAATQKGSRVNSSPCIMQASSGRHFVACLKKRKCVAVPEREEGVRRVSIDAIRTEALRSTLAQMRSKNKINRPVLEKNQNRHRSTARTSAAVSSTGCRSHSIPQHRIVLHRDRKKYAKMVPRHADSTPTMESTQVPLRSMKSGASWSWYATSGCTSCTGILPVYPSANIFCMDLSYMD